MTPARKKALLDDLRRVNIAPHTDDWNLIRRVSGSSILCPEDEVLLEAMELKMNRFLPKTLLANNPDYNEPGEKWLYWLGPDFARAGILENADWVRDHALVAGRMFPSAELQPYAVAISILHPYALDYLKSAPVIVYGKVQDIYRRISNIENSIEYAKTMKSILSSGKRLREVMSYLGYQYPMREIKASALGEDDCRVIPYLSKVAPSVLAQSIPTETYKQRIFIRGCKSWVDVMRRNARPGEYLLDWFMQRINNNESPTCIDVADFAAACPYFDRRWTYEQAVTASQRWHNRLQTSSHEDRLKLELGVDWDAMVDYDPFPNHVDICDYSVVALRSPSDLYKEGLKMHHCVGSVSYIKAVIEGRSRIFSVRKVEKRIGTFELECVSVDHNNICNYRLRQLKGVTNSIVPPACDMVVEGFLNKYRKNVVWVNRCA